MFDHCLVGCASPDTPTDSSCFAWFSEEARNQRKVNQEIEHELKKERRNARNYIKLLLLGTGESGKSTFIRQMRIIHEHGYESPSERLEYLPKIHQNILATIYTLSHALAMFALPLEDPSIWPPIEAILRRCTNFTSVNTQKEQLLDQLDFNHPHPDTPTSTSTFSLSTHPIASVHIMCLLSYQSIVQVVEPLLPEDLDPIRTFWNDPTVQKVLKRRNEFNLMDSSMYYMARIEEILAESYIPTVQDILRVRIPTNGINEYTFSINSSNFLLVDVGGQRTERRKWIHCFENVTSIIFLVALNEFDQVLSEPMCPMHITAAKKVNRRASRRGAIPGYPQALERNQDQDPNTESSKARALRRQLSTLSTSATEPVNRLEESKALFKTIVTCEWFQNSSVILFLNKSDLFEEKILYGPSKLSDHFPAYDGPNHDPAAAGDYLLGLFYGSLDRSVLRKRVIYSHFTCATDTRNMKVVFQAVKDTILEQMLSKEMQIF